MVQAQPTVFTFQFSISQISIKVPQAESKLCQKNRNQITLTKCSVLFNKFVEIEPDNSCMKIGKKLSLFTVRFMIIIIICVTLTRYLGLPVFLFERHQPHHFDDFFFFPCRYFTVKLRILKITQTNPYALSYSRVWNKSRDKFIIFWFFSRGLRPFKGGHVYKLFGFLFF